MSLRVLLADESASIRKVFQMALQDFGAEIKSVPNGLDVVEVAETYQPHIIFADILLQKKNGYEVCQEIRQHPQLSALPVVLMWSSFMELDHKKYKAAGAQGELEKPFDVENMRQLIQDLVEFTRSQKISQFLEFPSSIRQEFMGDDKDSAPTTTSHGSSAPVTTAPHGTTAPTAPPPVPEARTSTPAVIIPPAPPQFETSAYQPAETMEAQSAPDSNEFEESDSANDFELEIETPDEETFQVPFTDDMSMERTPASHAAPPSPPPPSPQPPTTDEDSRAATETIAATSPPPFEFETPSEDEFEASSVFNTHAFEDEDDNSAGDIAPPTQEPAYEDMDMNEEPWAVKPLHQQQEPKAKTPKAREEDNDEFQSMDLHENVKMELEDFLYRPQPPKESTGHNTENFSSQISKVQIAGSMEHTVQTDHNVMSAEEIETIVRAETRQLFQETLAKEIRRTLEEVIRQELQKVLMDEMELAKTKHRSPSPNE
jgi:two-component system, cell cycle response regulator